MKKIKKNSNSKVVSKSKAQAKNKNLSIKKQQFTPVLNLSKKASTATFVNEKKSFSQKATNSEIIIKIQNLKMSFIDPVTRYKKLVINDVSLEIEKGKTLGIIGESGSGKTVLTSLLTGILPDNAVIDSGRILINGVETTKWNIKAWDKSGFRGLVIGQVFQNPLSTLNPVMNIGEQMTESLVSNKLCENLKEAYDTAISFLHKVKIYEPEKIMNLYPHQLSGGMRQRVILATILSLRPSVVILDEPTTALDPTVQAQILDIINEIKHSYKIAFIFITHDIGVIATIADKIAIMYAGQVVEYGLAEEILMNSKHPYTWGLLMSMPEVNNDKRLWSIPGVVPSDITNIKGDPFAPRNPYALAIDFEERPPMYKVSTTHYAATRLLDPSAPKFEPPKQIKKKAEEFNRKWK